jgi:hypothetical protein
MTDLGIHIYPPSVAADIDEFDAHIMCPFFVSVTSPLVGLSTLVAP